MKTGSIRHPANAQMMKVHQWQVDMLNGDISAAKLMSFFEYWHDIKAAAAEMDGVTDVSALIQHHTEPELEAGVFVDITRKTIGKALKKLLTLGVISVEQNPFNPYDRTRHFLFHPEIAQAIADAWNEIYQPHQQIHKAKNRICVPGNLSLPAIGNFADSTSQNSSLDEAKEESAKSTKESCSRQNSLDPKITSKISTKTTDQSPLTPQGGDGCDRPPLENFSESEQQSPAPSTDESIDSQSSTDEDRDSGKDKSSARKKSRSRFPQLTDKRISQFQGIWNQTLETAPWWSGWQGTDPALKDALKAFWAGCYEQSLDPFQVFEKALEYARDKSPFWGSPPSGGGKWTPIKILRKTKGHMFSLYAEAIAPESSHPYPHLESKGLSEIWVGPDPLDFDADLLTVVSKAREKSGKPFDDLTCKSSIAWMIENNKFTMLETEWKRATERKRAIAQNQAAREAADIQQNGGAYQTFVKPREEEFKSTKPPWFPFLKQAGFNPEIAQQLYEQSLEDAA